MKIISGIIKLDCHIHGACCLANELKKEKEKKS